MNADVQTQVETLKANNAADASAIAALEDDLNTPATQSAGDQVLAALEPALNQVGLITVFGADPLVNALTAEGYTVTPPTTKIPVTDASEAPAEDSTDAPTES